MTQVPEGWYADPAPQAEGQPPLLRYWDGRQWTEHVHAAAPDAPATQPLQAAQQAPYGQSPPAGQSPPYGQAPPAYQGTFAYPAYSRRPGPATPDGVPLAGWWQRVGAQLLDGLILTVVASIATLPIQLGARGDAQRVLDRYTRAAQTPNAAPPDLGRFLHDYMAALGPVFFWSILINVLLFVLYEGLFLRLKGATPGKMALGIAVRPTEAPGQLSWRSVGLRILFKQGYVLLVLLSPWFLLVLFVWPLVDDLWPLGDRRRQALHEKPAGTNVVRTR